MIDHVNPQRHDEPASVSEHVVKAPYKSLLDEYDDDGNYIGNNPKYMDKEEEEEEHNSNNNIQEIVNTKNN